MSNVVFFDFRLSQSSAATYCRRGENFVIRAMYREFSCESIGEKILKIGQHLPKLL